MFLFIAILNFAFYLMKLDPQRQYFDFKIKYYNKGSKSDKIINQYYVNWKSNKMIFVDNRVYDFGPFRYFVEYDVDTSKLKNDWILAETLTDLSLSKHD